MMERPLAYPFHRPKTSVSAALLLALAIATSAATVHASATRDQSKLDLPELFAHAWRNHPASQVDSAIAAELQAKRDRAGSWVAAPPTVGAGYRTDAPTSSARREGLRELELELEVPIALPHRRNVQQASVNAEGNVLESSIAAQRLKLAGEVREAYWSYRLALADVTLAEADLKSAQALAADAERRTKAGESARVDSLQAQAHEALVTVALSDAKAKRDAAAYALASQAALPVDTVIRSNFNAFESVIEKATIDTTHPVLAEQTAAVTAIQAKLNEVSQLASEAPSVSLTLANERTRESQSTNTARIGFTVPFDAMFKTGAGNRFAAPQIAQAKRELAQADAQRIATERQLKAELLAAQAQLTLSRARLAPAQRRAAFSAEATQLYDKAYRLGELDLPTRLRSESERMSAARDATRIELEVAQAVSKVKQVLGVLP
jgi:outer membrane protein, heavy metal efflux system